MQTVAIRVDASEQIGTGHLMRCLTLADALRARGARTRFVCRYIPDHLRALIEQHGHELALLDNTSKCGTADNLLHSHWLETSQKDDAQATLRVLSAEIWDWLIVDQYALDARWESALRQTTKGIMVIDDIADRMHNCDVLLDQNLYANMETRYLGKVPEHCRMLLGPHYAMLRNEFRNIRKQLRPRTGEVKRILVFFGGVDHSNFTTKVVEMLGKSSDVNLHIDVVIGKNHPNRVEIETASRKYGFQCHVQTSRMAELMGSADLAIGAGGSASWERCCLGLPTMTVSLAENQYDIAEALDRVGACVFLGNTETAMKGRLRMVLTELLVDRSRLAEMSRKAYSLVDGLGVDRVSQILSTANENHSSLH